MRRSEIMEEIRKSHGAIQPSPGDVHVNRPLTNISIAWQQDAMAFVADKVFPNIPVMKQSDAYFSYDQGAWMRSSMEERAPGTETAAANFMVATDTYYARVYGLHNDIPDQVRSNMDSPLSADRDATMFLTEQSMLQREKLFASQFLKTGTWYFRAKGVAGSKTSGNTYLDGAAADTARSLKHWSDDASNPIQDMKEMKRVMQGRTGKRPNILLIGRAVYDALTEHGEIIDRMNRGQTSGAAQANKSDLMRLLELDDIIVMDAIETTSVEGVTDTFSFIGGKNGLLFYRPSSPGIMVPSAGYTFSWTGHVGAGTAGSRIKRFRMEPLASDRIEIESAYDFKQVSNYLGMYLESIVA